MAKPKTKPGKNRPKKARKKSTKKDGDVIHPSMDEMFFPGDRFSLVCQQDGTWAVKFIRTKRTVDFTVSGLLGLFFKMSEKGNRIIDGKT